MLGMSGTRKWVYPMAIDGKWQRLRKATFLALHLVLFLTPWIEVQGYPAVRLDLPGRRLFLVGHTFTAADTIFLLLLLLFLAFTLFMVTALFGRIWCGYACPQTVLLESWIHPIERLIEGDRNARMRLDRAPWGASKILKKSLKWSLFAAAAVIVSGSFLSFFTGAPEFWTGKAGSTAYFLAFVFSGIVFLDFAWFREQFCSYLCPYARFQSVMADDESLTITYDLKRGEPRGGPAEARSDSRCIDCRKCVNVCPAGIDIRNGFQLECIACARCIDACETVMPKFGQPSLVQYGSLAGLEGRRVRKLRPRTLVYGTLLTLLVVAGTTLFVRRSTIEAQVGRAPGSLYQLDGDGWVRNTFTLRITNNRVSPEPQAYHVHVDGLDGVQVLCQDLKLGTAESQVVPLIVRVPRDPSMPRSVPITVTVSSQDEKITLDETFTTPGAVNDVARVR
jgi:cytochrome c oxidase accessory protein FixG